jgi:small-conductance mechanosensitive channel
MSEILTYAEKITQFKIFELNQTPITVASLGMFVFVLLVFYVVSKVIIRGLLRRVLPKFDIDSATQYNFRRIIHYLIMITGSIVAFQFVGVDLGGLAVIFGLLSVGIGFGLQNVTSNFVAGLILLFERPIRVGDRVTVGDEEGDVVAINMRSTTMVTLNNITVIIPNSGFISGNVINWSHGDPKIRLDISVGVSYNSDLPTVQRVLREVAEENPKVLPDPAPEVLLTNFGDSSWDMLLRVWISSPKRHPVVRSDLHCAIVEKFRANGVEIPFPQRDLHVRSPLPVPLTTGAAD